MTLIPLFSLFSRASARKKKTGIWPPTPQKCQFGIFEAHQKRPIFCDFFKNRKNQSLEVSRWLLRNFWKNFQKWKICDFPKTQFLKNREIWHYKGQISKTTQKTEKSALLNALFPIENGAESTIFPFLEKIKFWKILFFMKFGPVRAKFPKLTKPNWQNALESAFVMKIGPVRANFPNLKIKNFSKFFIFSNFCEICWPCKGQISKSTPKT